MDTNEYGPITPEMKKSPEFNNLMLIYAANLSRKNNFGLKKSLEILEQVQPQDATLEYGTIVSLHFFKPQLLSVVKKVKKELKNLSWE